MSDSETALQKSDSGAALQNQAGNIANDLDEVARVASMMAKSGFFDDVKTAAQAGVKILAGRELGIPEMAAMRGVHVMEGNTTLSGPLLAALIKRHKKYDYQEVECTDERAEIAFFENGEKVGTASFSMDEARQVTAYYDKNGQRKTLADKTNWKNYPSDMLFWRALTRGQRRYAPEVGMGAVYTPEEMGAETDADANVIDAEAEVADPEPSQNGQETGKAKEGEASGGTTSTEEKSYEERREALDEWLEGHEIDELSDALPRAKSKVESWPEEEFLKALEVILPYAARHQIHLHGPEALDQLKDWVHDKAQDLSEEAEATALQALEDEAEEMRTAGEEASDAMIDGETALDESNEDSDAPEGDVPDEKIPSNFPEAQRLRGAGLQTLPEVQHKAERGELTEIDGIGKVKEANIKNALDDMRTKEGPLFE